MGKEEIKKQFPKAEFFHQTLQEVNPETIKKFEVICIFIYSTANIEILSKLPHLKFIITRSMGIDHIDVKYCNENNIITSNVAHYGENTVAEFTFALLITISRKIIQSTNRVKNGSFDFSNLQGFDLMGKTIGLIGFGKIGQKFAKMCVGFEMNVIVYDINSSKMTKIGKEIGITFVSLNEILKNSDIISLHVPLLPQTKHIINSTTIKKMKTGVIILNSSRGDLIETHSLFEALIKQKISFVGLDVLENECMIRNGEKILSLNKKSCNIKTIIEDQMIINHPNAFVTPHNAFNSIDAVKRIITSTISQIQEFMKDK